MAKEIDDPEKAAKNDRNRTVRQRSAWIIKRMKSGKKKKR